MVRTSAIPVDADGFEIPFSDHDDVIESVAALDDPDAGEPEEWPEWVDDHVWTAFEPPYEPTAEDLADYLAWSDRLDAMHRLAEGIVDQGGGPITDEDLVAAGLPVG